MKNRPQTFRFCIPMPLHLSYSIYKHEAIDIADIYIYINFFGVSTKLRVTGNHACFILVILNCIFSVFIFPPFQQIRV